MEAARLSLQNVGSILFTSVTLTTLLALTATSLSRMSRVGHTQFNRNGISFSSITSPLAPFIVYCTELRDTSHSRETCIQVRISTPCPLQSLHVITSSDSSSDPACGSPCMNNAGEFDFATYSATSSVKFIFCRYFPSNILLRRTVGMDAYGLSQRLPLQSPFNITPLHM